MSLEQAIHRRWNAWRPLAELLPAARLFTAAAVAPRGETIALPFATLRRRGVRRIERTSGRDELATLVVRLSVWADSLDAAKRVAHELHAAFGRQSFAAGGVTVQDMKLVDRRETQVQADRWRIDLDYLTRLETEA